MQEEDEEEGEEDYDAAGEGVEVGDGVTDTGCHGCCWTGRMCAPMPAASIMCARRDPCCTPIHDMPPHASCAHCTARGLVQTDCAPINCPSSTCLRARAATAQGVEDGEEVEFDEEGGYESPEFDEEGGEGAEWQPDPVRLQHMRSAMMIQRAACLDLIGEKAFNELWVLCVLCVQPAASSPDAAPAVAWEGWLHTRCVPAGLPCCCFPCTCACCCLGVGCGGGGVFGFGLLGGACRAELGRVCLGVRIGC